jgi:hypothetical protein
MGDDLDGGRPARKPHAQLTANVRFSNRPVWVKRFQAIHQ